jgi:N-acetylglucosamine kinase-like BadF-type ATPase
VRIYLGVDGGGSKTRFLLIDEGGDVLASHSEGSAYYLEIGLEALQALLARGIATVLGHAGIAPAELTYAFLGLPAYGEDRSLLARLDAAPCAALPHRRYRCGNDMVCGWAGALAGADGINIVAGTGSIAYGEFAGRRARAGGWGELFGDEGSAYWLAREGLRLFARMSDGRTARGLLYDRVRRHFALQDDLELCAAIYGKSTAQRSQLAQLAKLVAEAAGAGDQAARQLFVQAAGELADAVEAVRLQLGVAPDAELPVSCSGGLFAQRELLLAPLQAALTGRAVRYRFLAARLPPEAGAALYAAKLSAAPLGAASIAVLESRLRSRADSY